MYIFQIPETGATYRVQPNEVEKFQKDNPTAVYLRGGEGAGSQKLIVNNEIYYVRNENIENFILDRKGELIETPGMRANRIKQQEALVKMYKDDPFTLSTWQGFVDWWKVGERGTQEKNTWAETLLGKNQITDFASDIYRGAKKGVNQALDMDDLALAFKVKDRKLTPGEQKRLFEAIQRQGEYGVSDEMIVYMNSRNPTTKNGTFDAMDALSGMSPTLMFETFASSISSMVAGLTQAEGFSWGSAAAGVGAGAGATTAAIAGQLGPQAALPEEIVTVPFAAIAGALGGLASGVGGALEATGKVGELIREEMNKLSMEFTYENFEKFVKENPEKLREIRTKAVTKGVTIAAVDTLVSAATLGFGKVVTMGTSTAAKVLSKPLVRTGAAFTIEGVSGAGGEYLSQKVIGEKSDPKELMLEATGGGPTTALSIGSQIINPPSYKIHGEKVTRNDVWEVLSNPNITDTDIVASGIEITNDPILQDELKARKKAAVKMTALPKDKNGNHIISKTDRERLLKLENALDDAKEKGAKMAVVDGVAIKLKNIKSEIESIYDTYEGQEFKVGDVKAAVDTQETIVLENYKKDIAFADKYAGIFNLKLSELENEAAINKYIKDNNLSTEDAKAIRLSNGFVNEKTGEIIINKQKALETQNVNVGNHELLHGVLKKAVQDKKIGEKLINDLRQTLGKDFNVVDQKIKEGNYSDSYMKENPDEYITLLSESILEGKIKPNQSILSKIADLFTPILRALGFKKIKFDTAEDTLSFLREYHKSIRTGKLSNAIIKATQLNEATAGTKIKRSMSPEARQQISDNIQEIGDTYSFEGGKKAWDEGGADNAITEIKQSNYLDDLIAAKFKGDRVPVDFVDKVYTELTSHIRNFNPETNDNLFGWINSQLANKAGNVYNREYKTTTEQRTAKDVDDRTKEGEVKVQVAAEKDVALQELEEQDISPQAEARRKREAAKKEEPTKSQLRQEMGIEDGSDAYNTVLETARKVLIRAYDAGKTARQIQRDLTKEASTYLFKQVKNMLGTKAKYIPTIKKLRVALVNSMFTADLVQMERNVADDQRVFTKFVGKLTSKQEVQDAVDNNLLPPSALNTIDKGQSVNLYEKVMPTEEQFVAFFDQPLVNPKTGVRSGLRGTRKDQLAKHVAASLNFDATMQVAQEPEVAEKRQQIAELRGETIDNNDIQILSATINRKPNLKFSNSSGRPVVNQNLAFHLEKVFRFEGIKNKKLTQKDIKKYAENLTYKIPGQGVTIGEAMSNKDKKAFTNYALGTIRAQEYAKVVDKDLRNELIKNFEKSIKEGKIVNEGILNEQKGTKVLNENTQNSKVVKGSGDTYIQLFNTIFGFEHKLGDAQWVSRTFNFVKGKFVPTTENTTENFNEDISKLIKEKVFSEINAFLQDNNIEAITDPNNLTSEQTEAIKVFKDGFQVTTEVSLQYVINDYINNKYSGDNAQSFLVIEGNVYLMPTESTSYENAKIVAKHFNNLNPDAKIKPLQLVDDVSSITVHVSAQVKDAGVLNFRMRPKLISKNFKSSEVNIYKNKNAAKKLGEAMNLAAKEIQNIKSSKSVRNARPVLQYSKTSRGMSAFDFDETLIDKGENFIIATSPQGKEIKITSGQWPIQGPKLAEQGYTFDFKDFVNVRGGVDGPLLQKLKNRIKKYGAKNNYILTARPPSSATAIHGWLKTKGINIPLENITGLGNSTGEAKAMWIAGKYSEGYNDIYFVDDALPNVRAVADVIDQLDIKGKSVQAKIKFSKSLDKDFNNIIEDVKGIDSKKRFSEAKGRARGKGKGRFRFFIPPSHEDFVGLLYNFIGRGEKGNKHRDFFEKALIKPLNRAFRELNVAKQAIANDYRALVKGMPEVRKRLGEKILKGDYTVEDAIRVYLFNKAGYEVPGLTKTDLKNLVEFVKSDPMIQSFADTVGEISRIKEGYISPGDSWQASNIRYDLVDATGRVGRAKFFAEYQENADIIFSDENMNKIRAAFGDNFVEALQDMLYRIKTGSNRPAGNNRIVNRFLDWINGSVGATMFFNARSAVLQTLSTVNFINFADNNIFKAAAAFANQKQFWSDFAALFNSDFLKQRRSGAAFDVNANEIAREVAGSKNPMLAAIKYLLNVGFLPTQLADSFAIASGGATFYRNRIKTYLKQGFSQQEAESKAFIDFQEIAEATQQSARPDMVSQQQTSTLGRIILAFQNVTAQYARIIKKSGLDLVNRRKSKGYTNQAQSDAANISRIIYYGAIQSIIFNALQNALFAMMFDEDEEDEEKTKKFFETKKQRVINGTIDSLLKGLGVGGAIISTLKNYAIKLTDNLESKSFFKTPAWEELLQLSPPIGIKIRKIARAERNLEWNKDVLTELPLDNLDNPIYDISTAYIEGFTNIPVARLLRKVQNISAALDSQNKWWQRIAVGAGWSRWDVGITDDEIKETKKAIRENNKRIEKETKLKKATPEEKLKIIEKEVFDLNKREQEKILENNNLNPKDYKLEKDRVEAIMKLRVKNEKKIDKQISDIKNYVPTKSEQRSIDLFKMNKKDQVNMLIDLGLSSKQIKELKYEEDRVNKIIELQDKKKSKKR